MRLGLLLGLGLLGCELGCPLRLGQLGLLGLRRGLLRPVLGRVLLGLPLRLFLLGRELLGLASRLFLLGRELLGLALCLFLLGRELLGLALCLFLLEMPRQELLGLRHRRRCCLLLGPLRLLGLQLLGLQLLGLQLLGLHLLGLQLLGVLLGRELVGLLFVGGEGLGGWLLGVPLGWLLTRDFPAGPGRRPLCGCLGRRVGDGQRPHLSGSGCRGTAVVRPDRHWRSMFVQVISCAVFMRLLWGARLRR